MSGCVSVNGVTVGAVSFQRRTGYDVWISNPQATAADYLAAIEAAVEKLLLYRERAPERTCCEGCDLCCRERLPLTSVDVRKLMPALGVNELYSFLERYAWVEVQGRVVDITMVRPDGACCLLVAEKRLCRCYTARPLACRLFICCPQTERALALREAIINQGEDELARWWLAEAEKKGTAPLVHEGDALLLARKGAFLGGKTRERKTAVAAFAGKSDYSEVLLREVCSPRLWQELTREGNRLPRRRGG